MRTLFLAFTFSLSLFLTSFSTLLADSNTDTKSDSISEVVNVRRSAEPFNESFRYDLEKIISNGFSIINDTFLHNFTNVVPNITVTHGNEYGVYFERNSNFSTISDFNIQEILSITNQNDTFQLKEFNRQPVLIMNTDLDDHFLVYDTLLSYFLPRYTALSGVNHSIIITTDELYSPEIGSGTKYLTTLYMLSYCLARLAFDFDHIDNGQYYYYTSMLYNQLKIDFNNYMPYFLDQLTSYNYFVYADMLSRYAYYNNGNDSVINHRNFQKYLSGHYLLNYWYIFNENGYYRHYPLSEHELYDSILLSLMALSLRSSNDLSSYANLVSRFGNPIEDYLSHNSALYSDNVSKLSSKEFGFFVNSLVSDLGDIANSRSDEFASLPFLKYYFGRAVLSNNSTINVDNSGDYVYIVFNSTKFDFGFNYNNSYKTIYGGAVVYYDVNFTYSDSDFNLNSLSFGKFACGNSNNSVSPYLKVSRGEFSDFHSIGDATLRVNNNDVRYFKVYSRLNSTNIGESVEQPVYCLN